MSQEELFDIPGYEGLYAVTKTGKVWSYPRKFSPKGKFLKIVNHRGYLQTGTTKESLTIHRILALTFIPNPNRWPQVNHINGVKIDNRIENLEWCTGSYNISHAFKNGLKVNLQGEAHPNAKLTNAQVIEIRKNLAEGETQISQARKYKVSAYTIADIKYNRRWRKI